MSAHENIPSIGVPPETVGSAPEGRAFGWVSDNPLQRAIARVPLPMRAKQLLGVAAVEGDELSHARERIAAVGGQLDLSADRVSAAVPLR